MGGGVEGETKRRREREEREGGARAWEVRK